jgi:hypothetical protein
MDELSPSGCLSWFLGESNELAIRLVGEPANLSDVSQVMFIGVLGTRNGTVGFLGESSSGEAFEEDSPEWSCLL